MIGRLVVLECLLSVKPRVTDLADVGPIRGEVDCLDVELEITFVAGRPRAKGASVS